MKKSTIEEFIKKSKRVHGDKYNYSLVDYKNNKTKVKIICPDHGEFEQRPDNHIGNKSGCPYCSNNQLYTIEIFIKKSNKVHDNKYDYSLVNYKGNKIKVKIICPDHGIFEQTPHSHLNGYGCTYCTGMRKLTTVEFIEKSKNVHGNKYDYSLVKYKNGQSKIKIICLEHGIFEQTPHGHLNGHKCIYCSGLNKKTTKEFIKKSNKVHDNKYDYSLVNYKGNKIKVKIICPDHGIFEQTPHSHLIGSSGCIVCGNNSKKINIYDFIEKSNKVHDNKYDYSLVEYVNSFTKIKIICPKHGIFEQTPHGHSQNRGCSKCNDSKGEIEISSYLKNMNIEFKQQYKFEDCKNKKKLPFDFYLPIYNYCVEYDGLQHYVPVKYFGGEKSYKTIKKHDKIKNVYCKKNNIKLIRIKYNENIIEKLKKELKTNE